MRNAVTLATSSDRAIGRDEGRMSTTESVPVLVTADAHAATVSNRSHP